jgi:hypothetical protein
MLFKEKYEILNGATLQLQNGLAHQPITDRNGLYKGELNSEEEMITLIPIGCTRVRVVAFPLVK